VKPLAAKILPSFLVAACLLAAQPVLAGSDYLSRPDVRAFIDSMSEEYGLKVSELERVLGDVRHTPRRCG